MTLLVDGTTVDRHLDTAMAIDAMRRCFALEAEGLTGPVSRTDLKHESGWMRVLPAVFEGLGVFGHKVISFRREVGVRYVISVFDIDSGDLTAVVDAEAITNARTAATTAVGTDLLCRQDVKIGAIVGTGSVARSQLAALDAVRPVEELRVFSRTPARRAAFIQEMTDRTSARLVDSPTLEAALDGAGLVTLATKSTEPMFLPHHLAPGVHVNSIGAARPQLSEVAPDAFDRFDRIGCDSVDLVFTESGDGRAAVEAGFDRSRASNLSEIVVRPSERDPAETTLFKSTGSGLQDLALATAVIESVRAAGEGVDVERLLTMKEFGPGGTT